MNSTEKRSNERDYIIFRGSLRKIELMSCQILESKDMCNEICKGNTIFSTLTKYLNEFKYCIMLIASVDMFREFKAFYIKHTETLLNYVHMPFITCLNFVSAASSKELKELVINEKIDALVVYEHINPNVFSFYITDVILTFERLGNTFEMSCIILLNIYNRNDNLLSPLSQSIFSKLTDFINSATSPVTLESYRNNTEKFFNNDSLREYYELLIETINLRCKRLSNKNTAKYQRKAKFRINVNTEYFKIIQPMLNEHFNMNSEKHLEVSSEKHSEKISKSALEKHSEKISKSALEKHSEQNLENISKSA